MHPKKLQEAFARGENITELLRRENTSRVNTEEIIEAAYDLQAGSHVTALDDPQYRDHKVQYGQAIADVLGNLVGTGSSVLEAGVGAGTTLFFVKNASPPCLGSFHGFDIAWSRIATCRNWLASRN